MYCLSLGLIFFLLVNPSLVLAGGPPAEKCYTAYGTQSVSTVPTNTKTVHKEVTKTVLRNTHPHTTVTPTTSVTTTITNTETDSTTADQNTDTATETDTTTTTTTTTLDTVTDTATSVTTSTTTNFIPTTTVPAPAGFTAALDGGIQNAQARKREVFDTRSSRGKLSKRPKIDLAEKKYPTSVMCIDFKYHTTTSRSIISRTGVITLTAPTSTISNTETDSTTTTTTIYPPDASTTVTTTTTNTVTATESPTTTTTTTSTTTETAVIATATAYAACDPDTSRNFIGGANGHGIDLAYGVTGSSYAGSHATSAADCCTQCFSIGQTCAQASYSPLYGQNNECQLDIAFSPNTYSTCVRTNSAYAVDQGLILSSGQQNAITSLCAGST